MFFFVRLHLNN